MTFETKLDGMTFFEVKGIESVLFINSTPHPFTLGTKEEELAIIPSDEAAKKALNCMMEEAQYRKLKIPGVELVSASPKKTEVGIEFLKNIHHIESKYSFKILILSSILTAQAYGFPCVSGIPAEGLERVPAEKKRMRPNKFTTF